MAYKLLIRWWHDTQTTERSGEDLVGNFLHQNYTLSGALKLGFGFNDGMDWLNGKHSLPAELRVETGGVEKNWFVFAGFGGIDLRSLFPCKLFSESSAKQASPSTSAPIKITVVKSSSQPLVPDPSDWNLWPYKFTVLNWHW